VSSVRRFLLRTLPPGILLVVLLGCGASTVPSIHSEPERLTVARQLMEKRQWMVASDLLKSYIANSAGSKDVDEAIELLGECLLHNKDWAGATVEFERLLRDYPESDSAGSAAYGLGEAYYGQSRGPDFDQEMTAKAIEQWQSYLRDYPEHWLNPKANERLAVARRKVATKLLTTARLYSKMGFYEPSRIYFERVEHDFGDLDIAADAMMGLAQIDMKRGRNAEAIARLQVVEERFHGQPVAARAARERARLEH